MKKTLTVVLILATLIIAIVCVYFFWWNVNVYGNLLPRNTTEITLRGDEIASSEELIKTLRPFRGLKHLTLGTYRMEKEDADRLQELLPGATIEVETFVTLFGKEFPASSETLDLSEVKVDDIDALIRGLSHFKNLSTVKSDSQVFTTKEKDAVKSAFPSLRVALTAEVSVYGVSVRDDVTSLDLSDGATDQNLTDILRRFENLQEVNLRGSALDTSQKKALRTEFPKVAFAWEVTIDGKTYDSLTEDLDLTNKKNLARASLLETLPLFSRLKRVDFSGSNLTSEDLVALREDFPETKIVWTVKMGKWSLKTDQVAFSVLIYTYNYERLQTKDIQVLKYCTDLQALDLGHQAITDISVIGEYLKDLRILILADNRISDLEPLKNLKHLHYLELFVNGGFEDLTPLASCRELVDLNISYSYRIHDIEPIMDLPLLERLWLEHTHITAEDVERLRKRYPNAEIYNVGTGSIDNGWREHPRYFAMIDMFHKKDYVSDEFSRYDSLTAPPADAPRKKV